MRQLLSASYPRLDSPFPNSSTILMASALRQLLHITTTTTTTTASTGAIPLVQLPSNSRKGNSVAFLNEMRLGLRGCYGRPDFAGVKLVGKAKASAGEDGIVLAADDPEDGVSLGTMKLPSNTDLQRFETLLFQWANSLCQGANLPLPVPLKVDKIPGGARLGFITVGDGKTEVLVYIDCFVLPPTDGSGPMFRAIRNGPSKDKSPPGEPRIMRSLLQALQKSVEIAKV